MLSTLADFIQMKLLSDTGPQGQTVDINKTNIYVQLLCNEWR